MSRFDNPSETQHGNGGCRDVRAAVVDPETHLRRVKAEIDTDLPPLPWDEQSYVNAAALRDEIEFLLLGNELVAGGKSSPTIESIRDWFLGCNLTEQLASELRYSETRSSVVGRARAAYAARLPQRERSESKELRDARSDVRRVMSAIDGDLSDLLEKIGVPSRGAPRATFAALAARTDSPRRRERLHKAWSSLRARRLDELAHASEKHVNCVRRSKVNGSQAFDRRADSFIQDLLSVACQDAMSLERDLLDAVPSATNPLAHVGYLCRSVFERQDAPQIALLECLRHAVRQLEQSLSIQIGVDFREPSVVRVFRNGALEGEILMDLRAGVAPNRTIGLRNRTDLMGIRQHPIALIQCGFREGDRITVQNAISLLHELGHAVHHVLIKGALPSVSGMDSLSPLHRESVALWAEKLLYRQDSPMPGGWDKVKSLEIRSGLVLRATISAIDRQVLATGEEESVVAAYERLDRDYEVSRFCSLSDVLEHFTRDSIAVTGGNFYAYAWAAAESCTVRETPRIAWFDSNYDLPTPDPKNLIDFYRRSFPSTRDFR